MPTIDAQIDARIRSFVQELHDLVRSAALDAVQAALGAVPSRTRRSSRAPRIAGRAPARRVVGGKRDPGVLARTVERVRTHVATHPGQGAEQIGKALGLTTAQLALPVKKLLAAKTITRKGVRRATRYFSA